MADETSRLRGVVQNTVGPAPWYWKTFPTFHSFSGQRFVWTHHGEQGPIANLVTLSLEQDTDKVRLALNTYCRPFLVPPHFIGVWFPETRNLRLTCFDPDQLKSFDLAEVAGWFKQSAERIYAVTAPVADVEISTQLLPGTQKFDLPEIFRGVDELILPTSYPRRNADDPAMALYIVYPKGGLVEVLPQRWFTESQYEIGYQWITRATRDPESQCIAGECYRAGIFLLQEDGCRLAKWVERI